MSTFDENQAVLYNQDKSCKISDLNIGFVNSLKTWIRRELLTKKDKKTIESGLRDNLRYSTNISRAEREELIVKDKLSNYSNLVNSLYSEIPIALALNLGRDKFKSKELSIELRDFIIEYLYNPVYRLLKKKAEDFYINNIDSYESEAEINITAGNITDSIDREDDIGDDDEGFLIEGLHRINNDKNYNELHNIVYSEDYDIAGICKEYDTEENYLRFSGRYDNKKNNKNIKDAEYELLKDIERESDVYLDIKPIHINIREIKDKLDKINYKRCSVRGSRTELNNKRAKFNRENNLRGKRNYLVSYNNNKLKFFNKTMVLETMINKFFNNILISKIIIDTADSLNNYVNLFSKFSDNYYSLADFNYLYGYEISEYRKKVEEDIRNNTGIYDRSSLEFNNYMPRHIKDIYISRMDKIARFNGELIIVDRDKENIEEDIKYMDSLIDYYREDNIEEDKNKEENKNKKKRKKRQAPAVRCSSFQDYLDKTVGKLINARIKSIVDKYNSDEDIDKRNFMSSIQKLNYKYMDGDYSAPLTDLFLLYFDRDTIGLLNNNCLEKVFKIEGNHKQKVLFNVLKTIYEEDDHIKNFMKAIGSQYIDENNNIVTGLQNKNLVIQLHKELYYRVFNLSYLSQAIEDRVKKIISRYYYIEYMNKWKKISDQVKDKDHYLYKYKGKLIRRNYNVAANLNMLFNIEDLFRDEYIDYLDSHNKFTLNDNFMKAKDAEPWPWYEESDRFMDIPLGEKLTLFEEYTLIDNEYIIEHVAKPIVVKFNELVNKIVSAKNKKSVLSNIQKLVRLNVNLEGITNITNDYINREYDYKTELNEAYDDYKRNIVDYIDDNIIMSRRSNIFAEYFDLADFVLYNNKVPYNLTHFTNNEEAFSLKNVIDKPGDTDCKDHFWLTDYEKVFGKRVRKENHPENLNWPDYNNVTELSGHMIDYIEQVAESRVLYKIKIEDINKL